MSSGAAKLGGPLWAAAGVLLVIVGAVVARILRRWQFWARECVPVFSHVPNCPSWQPVPATIPVWMFWDEEPLPRTIELCWRNWNVWCSRSRHNFKPTLVTNANLAEFIDASAHPCFDPVLTYGPALRADFIRLALLHRHGGVYLDASVVLTQPLDWIVGKSHKGHNFFQAFYNPRNMSMSCSVPVIETSFLAAPPNHPLVQGWLERMLSLQRCDRAHMDRMTAKVTRQANLDRTYHFAYHVLTQMLTERPLSSYGAYHVYNATDYRYLSFQHQTLEQLAVEPIERRKFGPLLKLIASERKQLEHLLQSGAVKRGSFIDEHLLSAALPALLPGRDFGGRRA